MADWTPIGDGELIADQPITQALMTRLRDNPIAIIERAAGAPTYGWTVTTVGNNANGYYRIWDDGFIECWALGSHSGTSTVVTLPTAFSDTNYVLTVYQRSSNFPTGGTSTASIENWGARTTSTFTVSQPTDRNFQWYARGY